MNRRLLSLALAAAVLAPVAASGQSMSDRSRRAGDGEAAAEAEVFMSALQAIGRLHLNAYNDSTLWARALDGLIEELNDPYAAVFTPEEVAAFEEETTGNYAGIGVQITELNDLVTVTKVFRGFPAARAGMLEGDVIVGVDGSDATEWTTQMASDSIRGPIGSEVEVRVRREGISRPMPFRLTRDEVHVKAVSHAVLDGGIGYIHLDRVARSSAREVDEAVRQLTDTRGLIIDLRQNPGGYLDESLMLSDLFLEPELKLASTRNRTSTRPGGPPSEESWNARMPARASGKPIIVLVDRYTASAAEILAGALQDHDRALVMGDRTFGKGVVQSVLDLPHGRKLRITTGTWHTPLGRSLHRERDMAGQPLPENPDTLPTVTTASGRVIVAGGGVFPDLEVQADTLLFAERELLSAAAEAEVPLGLRQAEIAFARAQELRDRNAPPSVDDATLERFLQALRDDGVPADRLDDPVERDYLRWRLRLTVADRMAQENDITASTEVRMERDPVLRQALELLRDARSQSDLFAAAETIRLQDGERAAHAGGKR